jgi:hypothetical protein
MTVDDGEDEDAAAVAHAALCLCCGWTFLRGDFFFTFDLENSRFWGMPARFLFAVILTRNS